MEKHLSELGLEFEMLDAVDGNSLSEQEIKNLLAPGANYIPGVVGCYLSHINAYQRIIDQNIDMALILEDDARLNPSFVPAIKSGVQLKGFEYCLLDCDDVSGETPVYYDPDSKKILYPGFPVYEPNIGPALLHAYLMTKEGAQRRVAHAWPIEKPVDIYSHLGYEPKMFIFVSPKGAFVSEHSRQSFTSKRNDTERLKLRFLRRFPTFYRLLDMVRLKYLKGVLAIPRLKREGILPKERRWRPMPSGRNVIIA